MVREIIRTGLDYLFRAYRIRGRSHTCLIDGIDAANRRFSASPDVK
jgi:hypothetical protein